MFIRPSDIRIDQAVAKLRQTPYCVHVATTGATGRLQQDIWAAHGASNTIVGLEFDYDRTLSSALMGMEPDSFCSEQAALYLAAGAYEKALVVKEESTDPRRLAMGVGMTASVAKLDERDGRVNHVFIAVRTETGFTCMHAILPKAPEDISNDGQEEGGSDDEKVAKRNPEEVVNTLRREQGEICDMLTLNMILEVAGVSRFLWSNMGVTYDVSIGSSSSIKRQSTPLYEELGEEMLHGNVIVWPDGETKTSLNASNLGLYRGHHIIFPGSFNPLHSGHRAMAALVETMTGKQVVYQMTGTHPDKGRVPLEELCNRADQCQFRSPVLLMEDSALYVEKAKLLPGYAFLIGVDAVKGLLNPKYYEGGFVGLVAALEVLNGLDSRFYVVGRKIGRKFVTLEDVLAECACPPKFENLFVPVSGRWDMSSTALREK